MSKLSLILKTAGGAVATTVTLVTALRENPEIAKSLDGLLGKLKEAATGDHPKRRFDAKMAAIDTAADAVAQAFPEAAEPAGWRRQAQALRVRGELAWSANRGAVRRKAMKSLDAETGELLQQINTRLAALQTALPPEDPRAS
ncbi:hypothetical protein [Tessaracoccus lapidicaptus]|uniref:hypothetical protein n=1 Tax=Tessaracoccus lapidicaptus TaxID=1427523 RepID=UPI00333E9348